MKIVKLVTYAAPVALGALVVAELVAPGASEAAWPLRWYCDPYMLRPC